MYPGPIARMARHWFQLQKGVMRRSCVCCLDGGSMRPGPTATGGVHFQWRLAGAMRKWCVASRSHALTVGSSMTKEFLDTGIRGSYGQGGLITYIPNIKI